MITRELLQEWRVCISPRRIDELAAGRESITVAELLALDISDGDKLWCLLHPEIIPEKRLCELACIFAERVLLAERAAGREPDPRSWAVIEVKRRHIQGGATDKELGFARDAAYGAVFSAARDAGYSTGDVTWATARAAFWVTAASARDTAWGTACAARDAAGDAELAVQLRIAAEAAGGGK